jgi:F0F1-type ATP synthase epsilon subunit
MSRSAPQPLQVNARAPFHVYYEGTANRVSASNQVGRFDVLPGHADFFSILSPGEVVIETDTDLIVFTLANGIVAVHDNQVMVFANI